MDTMLSVEDLSVSFRTDEGVITPVQGVSFQVEAGKTLGLVGESGSGKSVSTKALMTAGSAGELRPTQSLKAVVNDAQMPQLRQVLQFAREGLTPTATISCTFEAAPDHLRYQDLHFFAFQADEEDAAAGLVAHVVPFAFDRDAAQENLAELARVERMIRGSVEAANLALWNICPETGETWFSDIWYEMLGYEVGAFEPSLESWLNLLHPKDRPNCLAAFQQVIDGESSFYQADFRLKRADGSWHWIGASGSIIDRSDVGLPFLLCGIQADITLRKIAEAQLAETAAIATEHRNRLHRIADNTPVGMFEYRETSDGATTMPYISEPALETLGVTRDAVERDGNTVFQNVLAAHHQRMRDATAFSKQHLTSFKERYEIDHPERGRRWITANSVPERREDGATTWFGALYDITEEMEREAALQAARDKAVQMTRQMEILAMQDALTGLSNRRKYDI